MHDWIMALEIVKIAIIELVNTIVFISSTFEKTRAIVVTLASASVKVFCLAHFF